jgi:Holliday junction resolvase
MSTTPETKVKIKVKRILEERGAFHFSPASNGFGRAGIPDIIVCHCGYFLAIECKAGKGRTTLLQERELARIRKSRGVALVVNETNYHDVVIHLTWMEEQYARTLATVSATRSDQSSLRED